MTIDEAIKHCEEVADEQEKMGEWNYGKWTYDDECQECAKEHRQLAGWLRELKKYKKGIEQIKELIDDYKGWDNWDIVKGLQYALECLEGNANGLEENS